MKVLGAQGCFADGFMEYGVGAQIEEVKPLAFLTGGRVMRRVDLDQQQLTVHIVQVWDWEKYREHTCRTAKLAWEAVTKDSDSMDEWVISFLLLPLGFLAGGTRVAFPITLSAHSGRITAAGTWDDVCCAINESIERAIQQC